MAGLGPPPKLVRGRSATLRKPIGLKLLQHCQEPGHFPRVATGRRGYRADWKRGWILLGRLKAPGARSSRSQKSPAFMATPSPGQVLVMPNRFHPCALGLGQHPGPHRASVYPSV